MSLSPQFRPAESNAILQQEHAIFIEIAFKCAGYAVVFVFYILTLRNLLSKSWKDSWKMILFLTMQQIAIFIATTGNVHMAVLAFVYNRNIPGGPVAFENEFGNLPYFHAALAGNFISNWLQDGLLIYRFMIIWGGAYYLLIFPTALFLASVGEYKDAFSLIMLIQANQHAPLLTGAKNLPIFLIYFALSVALNIIFTLLIAGRLYWYRRRALKMGAQHSGHYLSVAAMLIESASLYSIVGLAQIISLKVNPAVATGIEGLSGNMTALAPLLIAYRVSVGRGWTRETAAIHGTNSETATSPQIEFEYRDKSTTVLASTENHIELQSNESVSDQTYKPGGYIIGADGV